MKIATWNVNSVKARLPTVLEVLREISVDVIVLQEIKCETDAFPRLEIEDLGYNCEVFGQKSYNGVAILSKFPIEDFQYNLPTFQSDEQARYIEALVQCDKPIRVGGLYLPNGNPVDQDFPNSSEKFKYKMDWMSALVAHAENLLATEEDFVLLGDYNCIPRDEDCWDTSVWSGDALMLQETRSAFSRLKWLGLADAFETLDGRSHQYTFWDYQGGAWNKDHGIRIDHILCSPQATDRLDGIEIYRKARGMEKPSDHVPVIGTFLD